MIGVMIMKKGRYNCNYLVYLFTLIVFLAPHSKAGLFPTVNSWCYCLQHMDSFGGDTVAQFWVNHYDVLIGARPYDKINALSPSTILLAYSLSTNLTAYNRDEEKYSADLLRLKNWVDTNFTNPDSVFESCFLHIKNEVTIKFAVAGSTMVVPAYSPNNPRLSRLPATWQKNSDWAMNLASSAYRRYWKEVLAPFYMENTDGIYLDVQAWSNGQVLPRSGNIIEFTSDRQFYDSLLAVTYECQETVHKYGANKYLGENNFGFDSAGTGNFQLYQATDFALHECNLYYYYGMGRMKAEIDGAMSTRDSGTSVLMQHRADFHEVAPESDSLAIIRDRMAGLTLYLMAQGKDIYFFSYVGGVWYGNDMRKNGWFNAIACDFGQPLEKYSIWATGKVPSNPTDKYEIWARKFSRALVLVKPRPEHTSKFDSTNATTHELPGRFRRLKTDGYLEDSVITQITLRDWEGAILIPDSIKDWKGPVFKDPTHVQPKTNYLKQIKKDGFGINKKVNIGSSQIDRATGKSFNLNGASLGANATQKRATGVWITKENVPSK